MRNGKKVIVIKIGSSTLVNEQGKLDRAYFDGLAAQVHALRQMGWSPLIVSSAAIACGLEALGIEERPTDMPSLQAAASVGQNALMATYAEAFSRYDVLTSCVLITRHSTAQRNAYLHARDTLERLIDFDVVPIINENDTVIGIAASGTTPYVIGALHEARKHGILTGCITSNPDSPMAAESDVAIETVVGPEFVTGSSRMKSGTAQKMALNMISTTLMIQLGRVKGNRMVNMQLTNKKLIDRGTRMIIDELGLDYEQANHLLLAHGSVKKAIDAYRHVNG